MTALVEFESHDEQSADEAEALLFVQWIMLLISEKFGIMGSGSGSTAQGKRTFNFGTVDGQYLSISLENGKWEIEQLKDLPKDEIVALANEAKEKAVSRAFCPDVVYETNLSIQDPTIGGDIMLHFMRLLAAPSWLARRRAAFPLVNDGNCDPVL
jgi:hypothetical protein